MTESSNFTGTKGQASLHPSHHGAGTLALALGALGVVYGDIGTSPLYAIKECFHGHHAVRPDAVNVLGVLSLVFWSLFVVIGLKYLTFIMRADNRGEGGMFALLALIPSARGILRPVVRQRIIIAGLLGAALLYGDGIITPAISVLSAVEGLEVATSALDRTWIVGLTIVILVALFSVQWKGTAGIGVVFGPVMVVWFGTIAILGLVQIAATPSILAAVNPWHAVRFFAHEGGRAFTVLGSVVLCITGGEALYADMGHFGWRPIKVSWYALVCPALLLNYFGQGALILDEPTATNLKNPFYGLVPELFRFPMTALATAAAVIASQALISGAFSLTRSAVQLGYLPRVRIVHTSEKTQGQIYIAGVNWLMMVACIGLVLAFRESTNLAAAYGIAVTAVMGITSCLWWFVADRAWQWPRRRTVPLLVLFLVFDVGYFSANIGKIPEGGWFPIVVALALLSVMATWKRGREILGERIVRDAIPLELFIDDARKKDLRRVSGTAVFMSSTNHATPPVLLHHVKHNKVLHEKVVLLSIHAAEVPTVDSDESVEVVPLDAGFYRVTARYGFMQTPNVPSIMRRAQRLGLKSDTVDTSYYLGRETLISSGDSGLPRWRKILFTILSKNAVGPTQYFGLPPGRVIELGMQVDL